jgi:hypothetical protein
MLLWEERNKLYDRHLPGYLKLVQAQGPELEALETMITNTPARTTAGRLTKTDAALVMLPKGSGGITQMARSALRDFVNNAFAQEGVAGRATA